MKKLGITLVAAALGLPIFAQTPQTTPTPAKQTTKKHAKKHHHKKSAAKTGTTPDTAKK